MYCSACGAGVPAGARFCPACASPLASAPQSVFDAPTELAPESGTPGPAPASRAEAGGEEERYLPGSIIAERYRVAGLLGRGGMGEVYRADDLKLGQPVALKFLPESVGRDPEWLERFLNEVKVARRVSHPNVCRVYDVGEVGGHHFLTMEYIDGEDLASLLRRIGRLPQDKAVQVARQVCAGLAASHDQGVLHRDLKPANVMIDGRGRAHLTDFGLAGLAETLGAEDVGSGTPAYMAPEQLAGREVTTRSDIYALGLVLYQLFTGKAAFEAGSVEELTRLQQESSPTQPTRLVEGLDPAVERVILRCLEREPADRPPSALAVSAALPGGDPLAAALSAGETPSPEMVAAAGEKGSLPPRLAGALLAGFVALAAATVALGDRYLVTAMMPLDEPRDVLIHRARELLAELGVDRDQIADSAFGFSSDPDVWRFLDGSYAGDPEQAIRSGRPAVVQLWYRVSREAMVPEDARGSISWRDPAWDRSGMAAVRLDTRGLLLELVRVPDQLPEAPAAPEATVDWDPVFAAAGLDPARFEPAPPSWVPPVYGDARTAWVGEVSELPGVPMRVEAAALGGAPVYFRLIGPWSRAEQQTAFSPTARGRVVQVVGLVLLTAILALGLWMARRNLRAGRGDRRGAARLATALFLINLAAWVLWSHHPVNPAEQLGMLLDFAAAALLQSGLAWALYLALEPMVRRRYPRWIIGWTRLLAGRYRDPRVARDVLVGAVAGGAVACLAISSVPLEQWLGLKAMPKDVWAQPFHGLRWTLGLVIESAADATFSAMLLTGVWFLLRRLLRLRWLAGAGFIAFLGLSMSAGGDFSYLDLVLAVLLAGIFLLVLMRFGLLALISTLVFGPLLSNLPVSTAASAWYATPTWVTFGLLLVVAGYAWRLSLGARAPFGRAAPAAATERPGPVE